MSGRAWLEGFDQTTLIEEDQKGRSRNVKREWIKRGYTHQCSLYGAITNPLTHESEPRRIEVLSDAPYTNDSLQSLYDFFQEIKPITVYTIWIYDSKQRGLRQVGRYDKP